MYDITRESSLNNIGRWIVTFSNISKTEKKIPLIMVGGKCDLCFKRTIPTEYAEKVSQKYNFVKYFECSSKTGKNVDRLFRFLTKNMMKFGGYI